MTTPAKLAEVQASRFMSRDADGCVTQANPADGTAPHVSPLVSLISPLCNKWVPHDFNIRRHMTLSRKEAASLLCISLSTLQRRTKAGRYQCVRSGVGQFAEVFYSFAGIGLQAPGAPSDPEPDAEQKLIEMPPPEPSEVDKRVETDCEFAMAYRSGKVSDSNGNKIDGTNERFPTLGVTSLLGPRRTPESKKPQSGTSHMDPRLLSDYAGPLDKPLVNPQASSTGTTRYGSPLADGITQEAYDEMINAWRRNGGRRSMGEQEMSTRRSRDVISSAFPKADRT